MRKGSVVLDCNNPNSLAEFFRRGSEHYNSIKMGSFSILKQFQNFSDCVVFSQDYLQGVSYDDFKIGPRVCFLGNKLEYNQVSFKRVKFEKGVVIHFRSNNPYKATTFCDPGIFEDAVCPEVEFLPHDSQDASDGLWRFPDLDKVKFLTDAEKRSAFTISSEKLIHYIAQKCDEFNHGMSARAEIDKAFCEYLNEAKSSPNTKVLWFLSRLYSGLFREEIFSRVVYEAVLKNFTEICTGLYIQSESERRARGMRWFDRALEKDIGRFIKDQNISLIARVLKLALNGITDKLSKKNPEDQGALWDRLQAFYLHTLHDVKLCATNGAERKGYFQSTPDVEVSEASIPRILTYTKAYFDYLHEVDNARLALVNFNQQNIQDLQVILMGDRSTLERDRLYRKLRKNQHKNGIFKEMTFNFDEVDLLRKVIIQAGRRDMLNKLSMDSSAYLYERNIPGYSDYILDRFSDDEYSQDPQLKRFVDGLAPAPAVLEAPSSDDEEWDGPPQRAFASDSDDESLVASKNDSLASAGFFSMPQAQDDEIDDSELPVMLRQDTDEFDEMAGAPAALSGN